MTMRNIAQRTATLLLAATAFVVAGEAALAQPADEDPANVITVVAPRAVTNEVRRSVSGGGSVVISIRITVRYADLDLARPAGAARLMTRIHAAAHDACRHLDRLYPLIVDRRCIVRAVADATPRANAVIAAAGK